MKQEADKQPQLKIRSRFFPVGKQKLNGKFTLPKLGPAVLKTCFALPYLDNWKRFVLGFLFVCFVLWLFPFGKNLMTPYLLGKRELTPLKLGREGPLDT